MSGSRPSACTALRNLASSRGHRRLLTSSGYQSKAQRARTGNSLPLARVRLRVTCKAQGLGAHRTRVFRMFTHRRFHFSCEDARSRPPLFISANARARNRAVLARCGHVARFVADQRARSARVL